MGALNIVRIIVQIIGTIVTLIGIGMVAAGLLSSGWQIMIDPGVGEIHQHGLWMDYVYSNRMHIAGVPAPHMGGLGSLGGYGYGGLSAMESGSFSGSYGGDGYYGYMAPGGQWIMTYKFGDAVYGDPVHHAQPYQIYALVLLLLTLLLAVIGMFLSYCASIKAGLAVTWAVLLFIAVILGAAGLIQFYIQALMPEYRFAYTDRMLRQFVGYSYWWSVVGVVGVGLGFLCSIAVAVLLALMSRRGEKAEQATIVFKPARFQQPTFQPTNSYRPGAQTPV